MPLLTLQDAIPRFKDNEERVDRFANGTDTETWATSGSIVIPSIAKFLKDKDTQINVGGASILAGATAAASAAASSASSASGSASAAAASAASIDVSTFLTKSDNLGALTDKAAARTSLQLGTAAVLDTGTTALKVLKLDAAGKIPAVPGDLITGITAGQVSGVAFVPKRQTVLSGPKNAGGTPSFLPATAVALSLVMQNVDASHPFVYTLGKGYSAVGEVNYINQLTTNAFTWTARASMTTYLHANDAGAAGQNYIPWEATYDGLPTYYPVVLLHFNNNYVDDYAGAWSGVNTPTFSATAKFGSHALSLASASSQYAKNDAGPNLNSLGQWTVEGWYKKVAAATAYTLFSTSPALGTAFGVSLGINTANKVVLNVSSNGTSLDVASAVAGTNAYADTTAYHHFALVFDGAAYKAYVDGVLEINTASAVRPVAGNKWVVGATMTPGVYMNGQIDEFRVSAQARYTAAFTAPVAAFTADEIWDVFDIEANQMYVWPAITAVNRVYVGECDASATAITATRAYAYRGEYDSGLLAIAGAATETAFNHNLGVRPEILDGRMVNISPELGYSVGFETNLWTSGSGANGAHYAVKGKLAASVIFISLLVVSLSTFGLVAYSTAKWKVRVIARRGW